MCRYGYSICPSVRPGVSMRFTELNWRAFDAQISVRMLFTTESATSSTPSSHSKYSIEASPCHESFFLPEWTIVNPLVLHSCVQSDSNSQKHL